jgi:hypothetical protein
MGGIIIFELKGSCVAGALAHPHVTFYFWLNPKVTKGSHYHLAYLSINVSDRRIQQKGLPARCRGSLTCPAVAGQPLRGFARS